MKVVKVSNYTGLFGNADKAESLAKDYDRDLNELFTALNGRLRFGTGDDGDVGENIEGEFQEFTSDATPDTEFSVSHSLGSIPVGSIIMWQDKAGHLYQGPTTGTNWTSSQVYFKCDVASVTFNVFLVK